MSIKDFERRDSVTCTARFTNDQGTVLSINGVPEKPYVILYDVFLPKNSVILASIFKISPDYRYLKVKLDSILDAA